MSSAINIDNLKGLPLFLVKLLKMLNDPALYEVIRWDANNESFHIVDTTVFSDDVLPKYFKHRNLNSFVRQLNFYGFRKRTTPERSTLWNVDSPVDDLHFMHPKFIKHRPDLMYEIKRQTNPTKKLTTPAVSATNAAVKGEFGSAVKDLDATSDEIARLRREMNEMKIHNAKLRTDYENLHSDHNTLWHEVRILRETNTRQNECFTSLMHFLSQIIQQPNKKVNRRIRPIADNMGNENSVMTLRASQDILGHIHQRFIEGMKITQQSVFDSAEDDGVSTMYYDDGEYQYLDESGNPVDACEDSMQPCSLVTTTAAVVHEHKPLRPSITASAEPQPQNQVKPYHQGRQAVNLASRTPAGSSMSPFRSHSASNSNNLRLPSTSSGLMLSSSVEAPETELAFDPPMSFDNNDVAFDDDFMNFINGDPSSNYYHDENWSAHLAPEHTAATRLM